MSSPEAGERADRFHRGRFTLIQPAVGGYRAGLDAMLLAATVAKDMEGTALDLGAGTGAVGLGAAALAPALRVVLAERDEACAAALARTLSLAGNADFAARSRVARLDVLAGRAAREAAGLADGGFDLVLTNPPFYPANHRVSPDPRRRAALNVEGPDFLLRWLRVAAALVAPRGRLHAIVRPADLPTVFTALENRLGALSILPVHTRPGAATRLLVGARRGSRAAPSILRAVVLFGPDGSANELSGEIGDGAAHLSLAAGR
ncbi:methyltransferase [Aureimonas mangrovi]|uniref:methyltransferase n=1 Tax=Aureimonas mangrovi TaxID=2758041 RepID=UPI00163D505F|nr:methyltransferase [Aureimonas mangrovi]